MQEIVEKLTKLGKSIATMESCTGGAVVNAITNIEGASNVLKFSAVTYSNEYKIKLGVSKDTINTYSVYSIETAKEMSFNISKYADSDYGIGITGKLNRVDNNNPYGEDNVVFISIYDKEKDKYTTSLIKVKRDSRRENKEDIILEIEKMLLQIIS